MRFKIVLAEHAEAALKAPDAGTRRAIAGKIEDLRVDPHRRGKTLVGQLSKYRSIHAAGRYRIIYEVRKSIVVVFIVAVGTGKEGYRIDVYEALKRLIRLGAID